MSRCLEAMEKIRISYMRETKVKINCWWCSLSKACSRSSSCRCLANSARRTWCRGTRSQWGPIDRPPSAFEVARRSHPRTQKRNRIKNINNLFHSESINLVKVATGSCDIIIGISHRSIYFCSFKSYEHYYIWRRLLTSQESCWPSSKPAHKNESRIFFGCPAFSNIFWHWGFGRMGSWTCINTLGTLPPTNSNITMVIHTPRVRTRSKFFSINRKNGQRNSTAMNNLILDSSPASDSGQFLGKNNRRNSTTTNSIILDSSPASGSVKMRGKNNQRNLSTMNCIIVDSSPASSSG